MTYTWGVDVPSRDGGFELNLSSPAIADQLLRYGKNQKYLLVLLGAWISIISDSPYDQKPNRAFSNFVAQYLRDPLALIKSYSEYAAHIQKSCNRRTHLTGVFLPEMQKTPVFREYLLFFKTGNPEALKYVLTFLLFGKKAHFDAPELEATAFRKWLDVEQKLSALDLPEWAQNLTPFVSLILETFDDGIFLPKHGSGAVSEPGIASVLQKHTGGKMTKCQRYLYYDRPLGPNASCDIPASPPFDMVTPEDGVVHSRLKFVPKDWKTRRSICMEPVAYQYLQQGVRLWLEDAIDNGILHGHVVLRDQTVNQSAAKFGSRTGLSDTVDLSSASDSVSWELVAKIFPPKVLKHLVATRTKTVKVPILTEGSYLVNVKKFAPMGSALCFPVQCIVYSAVNLMIAVSHFYGMEWWAPDAFEGVDLKRAIQRTFRRQLTEETGGPFQPFYVYGDDIICDFRLTSSIMECLSALGFEVNADKSFVGEDAYRESCGIHCYMGYDVTPVLYKIKSFGDVVTADVLVGVVDTINTLWDSFLNHTRRFLINFALHYKTVSFPRQKGKNAILFSSDRDQSFSVYSPAPQNSHLNHRWDVSLSKTTYKCAGVSPDMWMYLRGILEEYYLDAWWRSHRAQSKESGDRPLTVRGESLGLRARWRWTAA